MRISKKSHEVIRQNEQIVKKSQKHDANLQKNSVLYFQIGLIACLLGAYGLLEMKFDVVRETTEVAYALPIDNVEPSIKEYKVYVKPVEEIRPVVVKKVVLTKEPIIKEDDDVLTKVVKIITGDQNITTDAPTDPTFTDLVDEPTEASVPFERVEVVPIYPGCENKRGNEAKKKCMSEKLTKLIQKKFNTDIAGDLGLSGIQKIQTQFTIDKLGNITDIKTRSPYSQLEKEVKRVINIIPSMKPGKQRNEPVGVRYVLPIKFQVHN